MPHSAARGYSLAPGHAHARLRAETCELHATLEKCLVISELADREMYVRYLLMNLPCGSIERGLVDAGVHRLLPDWDQRRRGSALADDLALLGVPSSPCVPHATDSDIGTILGWCYVLEGSRLGARAILQVVEESKDPQVGAATRFLRHGDGMGLWRSFKAALSRIDNDAVAIGRACTAAKTAFECFRASDGCSRGSRQIP